jgi:hypothetical protein
MSSSGIDRYIGSLEAKHLVYALAIAILLGVGVNLTADILIGLISRPKQQRILIQLGVAICLIAIAAVVVIFATSQ